MKSILKFTLLYTGCIKFHRAILYVQHDICDYGNIRTISFFYKKKVSKKKKPAFLKKIYRNSFKIRKINSFRTQDVHMAVPSVAKYTNTYVLKKIVQSLFTRYLHAVNFINLLFCTKIL